MQMIHHYNHLMTEELRQKVRAQLILEKVLTKDIVIEDSTVAKRIMRKINHCTIFQLHIEQA